MQLSHHDVLLGALRAYGYETPWASAWLVAAPEVLARYSAVCAFLTWVEAQPDDLTDADYERERAARGVDAAFLDAYGDAWVIVMPDGERREIQPPWFDPDGFLTWRW